MFSFTLQVLLLVLSLALVKHSVIQHRVTCSKRPLHIYMGHRCISGFLSLKGAISGIFNELVDYFVDSVVLFHAIFHDTNVGEA